MNSVVKKINPCRIGMKGVMLTESELAGVSGGSTSCNCANTEKTGKVIKHWIVEGYIYWKEIEYKCPDCGEVSWRYHYF